VADLLDDLDAEQQGAALASTGPVCIVAGAGTGKTRTVTYRLAHAIATGAVEARRALAITHSRKAATELSERLDRLGVGTADARTFHAAGLRVARQFWAHTGRPEPSPSVLSDGEAWRLWRDTLRAVTHTEPDNAMVRDTMAEVGWARSRLVDADGYPAAAELADRHPGVDVPTVVRGWDRHTTTKARLGKVDFADLLDIASDLIMSDGEVAGAVRWRWSHVTVDEYQDTDPAQQRLLDAILGDGQDICVVGDPRQAIYSWKGAEPSYLTGFATRYPTARVFDLTRNYRSSSQILDWANRLARQRGSRPLVATRPNGPVPKVTQLDSESGEATWVAGAARQAIATGTPRSEIAVLYRFNATQARFEAAFARAGIVTVVADDTPFFERNEIRSILVPFGQTARAQPDRAGLELITSMLARAGFDRGSPPDGLGAARARWENQQALLELVEASPRARHIDAGTLLAEINGLATKTHGPRDDGVTLATLHRAKGLEWEVVFVVGVTDGAIPSTYASTTQERAEEERLLHVGVTRARRELHLTWPSTNARGWTNRPSPLLDLLPTRRTHPKAQRHGATARKRSSTTSAGAGASSGICPHCTDPLKGSAARRLGVCPDCVNSAPGTTGTRARAITEIVTNASSATGIPVDQLMSRTALVRLLDRRPTTVALVTATAGVSLPERWAHAVADIFNE